MFRAIKLNPFSTPSDPKLTFRASHVPRLYSETIAPSETEYWSTFYTLFDNAYDVFNLIQSADIAKTLQSYPQNLVTLVNVLSERAQALLRDDAFPSVPKTNAGIAAYATTLLSKENIEEKQQDPTRRMLNCLRVLGRVIPFILAQEDSNMEDEVFWTEHTSHVNGNNNSAGPAPFVIDDDEEDNGESSSRAPPKPSERNMSSPPLAEKLMDMAVDLLFVHGFTLPPNGQDSSKKVSYTIWENGIGSNVSLPATSSIDSNRIEVLRFLLILISKTLYIPSNAYSMASGFSDPIYASNRWHTYLVKTPSSAMARKMVLSLLCSLFNTSLKSGAFYASNAGGIIGTVGGAVGDSYEKLVSGGKRKEDPPRLGLVKMAVQVLNAVLCTPTQDQLQAFEQRRTGDGGDLRSPPPTPSPGPNASFSSFMSRQSSWQSNGEGNAYRFYLSKLHRSTDVGFIIENLLVILGQPMSISLLKLPLEVVGASARSAPTMVTDFLILLWRLIDSIPSFAAALLENGQNTHQMMAVLLYLCLEYKDDPSQIGLVKLCAFLLQTISAERSFGSALNKPLDTRLPLPSKYAIPGSAGDFLVQQIYSLIFSTRGSLNAIYPAFILTITNVSPYLKNLSIRSSTRLVQLFLSMSSPTFLLSDEAAPRLVYYLLEAFNNIIQFQLSDCPNLIYSLIRSHARFEELATFTVASGVASIRRARKQRSAMHDSDEKPSRRSSNASERSSAAPLATPASESGATLPSLVEDEEKAALMRREQEQEQQKDNVSQPPTPTSEYPPRQNAAGRILSEKAAGKQPMRSNSQLTLYSNGGSHMGSEAGDTEEGQWVAKNGFVPTEAWVASWREGLPIDPILILVSECLPKVSSLSSLSTNTAVIEYLKSVTLVGLLPPSPPVKSRRFMQSLHSTVWLTSLAWGNIFLYSLEVPGAGAWRDTNVKLLNVRQRSDRGGVQGVMTNLVEQGLGMLNLGGINGGTGSGSNGATSPTRSRRLLNRSRSSSQGGGVV